MTPTDVYIRSRSVPRANYALIGTLLGALYTPAWVSYSVRSIKEASYGLSYGTSRCKYPVFSLCRYQCSKKQSGSGVCQNKRKTRQQRVTDKQQYEIHFTSGDIELEN